MEALAGEPLQQAWRRGGAFVGLGVRKVYVETEGQLLAIPRRDVASIGVTRASSIRRMRWGLGLYALSFLFLIFRFWWLAIPLATAGGVLVVLGFLGRALVLQLRDARIPPIVLPHARWRRIGRAIQDM